MGARQIAILLMLAVSPAFAQTASPPGVAPDAGAQAAAANTVVASGRLIFLPPPIEWDNDMLSNRPALHQTQGDFSLLAGGIAFGMSPSDLNTKLPEPYPGMSWGALTLANEYPGEVRYFGVPMEAAGPLRMGATGCMGSGSYLVFLFRKDGLFRLSYRLAPDKSCAETSTAAQQIFARYVTIGQTIAMSDRYRSGNIEIVDITDPTAGYLAPVRWRQGGN